MLRYITILLLASSSFFALGQNEDKIWALGYNSNGYLEHPGTDRIFFDFIDSLLIQYSQGGAPLLDAYASICDSSGSLLLLSNGCYVETGDGVYVEGSYGLNPGYLGTDQCYDDSSGYNVPQSMLMLEKPGNLNQYYLFHVRHTLSSNLAYFDDVLLTVVDYPGNTGNGTTISKNQVLVNDTIHADGLAAVRHANGRDWWVAVAKDLSNKYYLSLLGPEGISVQEQSIGEPTWGNAGGEMVFSPEGSKMARFNCKDDLRIFDFDRCTGTLSNPIYIPIQDNADNEIFAGLAFSADGHYLYAAEIKRMLQFDMWATDIAASMVIVAERDLNTTCNLGKAIGYMELGPDGRIYCRPGNGQSCMHRMKHPERAGSAAEFVQYYYHLDFSYKNLPHFPNFRLGPIDGSSCDTLGLDNHPLAGWRYDKTGGLGVDFTSVSWYEPETWWWDFGDPASGVSNQSNARNPAHTFSAPGAYEVCLTVSNQYGSDTKCKWVWVNTVGSSSPEEVLGVTVFPNPSTGYISWKGIPEGQVTVRVFNALGQLQLERQSEEQAVDLSTLSQGLYRLQILSLDQKMLFNGSVSLLR